MIARGNGRSYGDPALSRGLTLSMAGLDRMLSFDATTGTLVAEAGVLLADIIATFLPRGWFPRRHARHENSSRWGGAIAADVHGKEPPSRRQFPLLASNGSRWWEDGGAPRRIDRHADPERFDTNFLRRHGAEKNRRDPARGDPPAAGRKRSGSCRRRFAAESIRRGDRYLRGQSRRALFWSPGSTASVIRPGSADSIVMMGRHDAAPPSFRRDRRRRRPSTRRAGCRSACPSTCRASS